MCKVPVLLCLKHSAMKAAVQRSAADEGVSTYSYEQPLTQCVSPQQAEGHLVGIGEGHSLTDEVHVDAMLKDPSPKDESSAPLPSADATCALSMARPRKCTTTLITQ